MIFFIISVIINTEVLKQWHFRFSIQGKLFLFTWGDHYILILIIWSLYVRQIFLSNRMFSGTLFQYWLTNFLEVSCTELSSSVRVLRSFGFCFFQIKWNNSNSVSKREKIISPYLKVYEQTEGNKRQFKFAPQGAAPSQTPKMCCFMLYRKLVVKLTR